MCVCGGGGGGGGEHMHAKYNASDQGTLSCLFLIRLFCRPGVKYGELTPGNLR